MAQFSIQTPEEARLHNIKQDIINSVYQLSMAQLRVLKATADALKRNN